MTTRSLLRFLTTSALCLAALGLSSCVTTVHRYVWNRAKIVDEAYWVEDAENIELYRVGNTVYAKGFIGPARGGQTLDDIPAKLPALRGGATVCFNPIREQSRPVYIKVNSTYTELRQTLEEGHAETRMKMENGHSVQPSGEVFLVSWFSPESNPCLTQLPAGAIRLTERGWAAHSNIGRWSANTAHTDAHKYYAYPLGALIAVGVDVPLSLAGNALLLGGAVGGAVVALPSAGVYAIYESCTQKAPEAVERPAATTANQNN
ncbi:MAG: hypothetical protein IKJ58_09965 [Akkermansia sp.]|nr:hypothetical protein [Akkermansia sp.]